MTTPVQLVVDQNFDEILTENNKDELPLVLIIDDDAMSVEFLSSLLL